VGNGYAFILYYSLPEREERNRGEREERRGGCERFHYFLGALFFPLLLAQILSPLFLAWSLCPKPRSRDLKTVANQLPTPLSSTTKIKALPPTAPLACLLPSLALSSTLLFLPLLYFSSDVFRFLFRWRFVSYLQIMCPFP